MVLEKARAMNVFSQQNGKLSDLTQGKLLLKGADLTERQNDKVKTLLGGQREKPR